MNDVSCNCGSARGGLWGEVNRGPQAERRKRQQSRAAGRNNCMRMGISYYDKCRIKNEKCRMVLNEKFYIRNSTFSILHSQFVTPSLYP
jgi:hypothetical protein